MASTTEPAMVDWHELDRRLRPSFREVLDQLQTSLSYDFVVDAYDHTMPGATAFAEKLLGGDTRHRYDAWLTDLTGAFHELQAAGVTGYADLVDRIGTPEGVETLIAETGMSIATFAGLVYYLRYWVLPMQQPIRTLIDPGDAAGKACASQLKEAGIRGTLDLLEVGRTIAGRRELATRLDIPEDTITALVHRADMTRLPFTSRKTIAHLTNAGAGTIALLASTPPQTLVDQVLAYGETIGKNLRYGVEPGSSGRVAQILPRIVQED